MLRITSSTSEDGYHLQIDESELNITKSLFSYGESIISSDSQDEEERDQQNMQIDSDMEEYPPQTFHHLLPRMENVIAYSKWRNEKEPDSKDDRNKKNGEYAKAILNSPSNPELHTIEKERQHKTRENFKTLYGSYEDSDGNEPQIAAEDLLQSIVKHINREFIYAFYKTAKAKFIVVLKQKEHKDIFTHEKNFKERIHDQDFVFRILPRVPNVNGRAGGKRQLNSIFMIMFLPTIISDSAVGNAFINLVQCILFMQALMIKVLRKSKMEKDTLG